MAATTTTTTAQKGPFTLTLNNGLELTVQSNDPIDADEIPVIDISGIYSENLEDRKAVAEKIREAAHRIGFFYIIGHGIDQKYIDGTFSQAKRFFELPIEQKMEVCTDKVPEAYFGYFPMARYNRNQKKLNDLMEAYNWGYNPEYDEEAKNKEAVKTEFDQLWPKDVPGFKEALYEHHSKLLSLARRMVRVFALALHLPENFFDDYVDRPEAAMRIAHYPQQEASSLDQLGIGAHTDFECFTLLTQDHNGGLEVLSKSGYWINAKPIPGAMVVNIADCLMRQTNDYFVSTVHRVVNKTGAERYSCPFFFGFNKDKKLEPVPTCVSEENPMKYPIMSTGDYLKERAAKSKSSATATKAA
ncbi:hypothetical protein PV10_04694 [Exophiala mesophila]|uniref:Fe2OG dioxygenase domain-containing protein n=1 Tax=Exophiala mesophila TaxID=212818 RepID=A0A0D2A3B8_EXOME|nr:uncharacterized protein PV10_04694 [Exophiala mesophila]KIV93483.1 hypothetical protein PV10_04694 [Exophiala mesophila]